MIHELNIRVKEEDFIAKYLQTVNGIWKLNKPEFKIVEYILKNNHVVTKTSADIIALGTESKVSNIKLSLKDLMKRGVLVELDSIDNAVDMDYLISKAWVINPKLYTGANKVVINFNVV